jgi:hypothetical protein
MGKKSKKGDDGTGRWSRNTRQQRAASDQRHRRSHPKKNYRPEESTIYQKANFTHFRELLEEYEQIKISYTSLSCMLKGAGITSPKTRRSAGERRTIREWRAKFGELVLTDAALFHWFGSGIQYALHGFQDDAAGDIPAQYLCEHECLQGYFEAFRAVLQGYGAPEALYADQIGIYFMNTKKPENWSVEEQLVPENPEQNPIRPYRKPPGQRAH